MNTTDERITKAALNNLTDNRRRPTYEMSVCCVCNKPYKVEKTCHNHIIKEHPVELSDEVDRIEIENAHRDLAYTRNHVIKLFKKADEEFAKVKAEFLEQFEDSPTDVIHWNAEDIVKAQAKANNMAHLKRVYLHNRVNRSTDITGGIKHYREMVTRQTLDRPPRYSSTSAMSNQIEVWTHEVDCEFVNDRGSFGGLTELLWHLERRDKINREYFNN